VLHYGTLKPSQIDKIWSIVMNYNLFADLKANLPDIPENSIISQTLLDNEKVKVILFGFAPGQELSEHTASMPAIIQFIEGTAQVVLGKDETSAHANTWFYMQPHLAHSIKAQTKVIMLLLLLK
jgi:quercetin dioxygenase-like cupin family protein